MNRKNLRTYGEPTARDYAGSYVKVVHTNLVAIRAGQARPLSVTHVNHLRRMLPLRIANFLIKASPASINSLLTQKNSAPYNPSSLLIYTLHSFTD